MHSHRAPDGVGGRRAGPAVLAVLSSELSAIDVSLPAEILCSGGSTTTKNSKVLVVPRAVFRCSVTKQPEPIQHRNRRGSMHSWQAFQSSQDTANPLSCQYRVIQITIPFRQIVLGCLRMIQVCGPLIRRRYHLLWPVLWPAPRRSAV